jgi:hypothetical protein
MLLSRGAGVRIEERFAPFGLIGREGTSHTSLVLFRLAHYHTRKQATSSAGPFPEFCFTAGVLAHGEQLRHTR